MYTRILYYKKFEGSIKPVDYVNWAVQMLENDFSTQSLCILASLNEPLNVFEVEDYFMRASRELRLREPTQEECAESYIYDLFGKILNNEDDIFKIVDEIYYVIREHLPIEEELSVWYDISEKVDDFRYGDNITNITKETLAITIVEEAKKQLKSKFFLN